MTGDHASLLGAIFDSGLTGGLTCKAVFDCNSDLDSNGGIILWFAICLYMFKQLGTICDEYFVPSLEVIVEKLDMSNDVAGATFMAAGSSAPELFTSLVATFFIVNEGGVGTIVGSAIFNILVIVGATGWCACKDQSLKIWWYPLTRDCIFYMISIIELTVVLADDEVFWYESVFMVLTYFLYIFYMWMNPSVITYFGLSCETEGEAGDDECLDGSALAIKQLSGASGASSGETPASWSDPVHEVAITSPTTATSQPLVFSKPGTLSVPGATNSEELPNAVPDKADEGEENAVAQSEEIVVVRQGSNGGPDEVRKGSKNGPDRQGSKGGPDEEGKDRYQSDGSDYKLQNLGSCDSNHHKKIKPSWSRSASQHFSQEKVAEVDVTTAPAPPTSVVPVAKGKEDEPVCEDTDGQSVEEGPQGMWRYLRDPLSVVLATVMPAPEKAHWSLFTMSIAAIALATYMMVDSVNRAGIILKVPPLVMGLTVLAAGTSIPDAMGSIAVAKQGEGDMAVANALGSNIFDILVGLGIPWTIRCAMGNTVRFPGKFDTMRYDFVILASVLVLFVGALLLNRWRLTRKFGSVLIVLYFVNVIYNILAVYVLKTKEVEDD